MALLFSAANECGRSTGGSSAVIFFGSLGVDRQHFQKRLGRRTSAVLWRSRTQVPPVLPCVQNDRTGLLLIHCSRATS
jgi:hypothetical protein